MYLHRIELHGFKSFADRTTVQFDPGVTAIVGPNGCGKSNIIDAVRWVLGEQRARLLRSEKMENVIFNGTSTRRALGMAEVSLTIHNTRGVLPTEYSEVTVGRRLYRSGESDYILNGTTCRLKDVLDLFMDTGMGPGAYSVIELKMIEDLLSENPQDRRRLFEEAAGITKYKLRRAQALRRLDQTQADLDRLRDITEEIDRQVRTLARQAKKAERHRDVVGRLREVELQLAAFDYRRLHAHRLQLDAEAAALEEQLTERTVQLQAREAESEAQRTALVTSEQALAAAQRRLNEHVSQIREAEAEARLATERESAASAAIERLDREEHHQAERLDQVRREAEQLSVRLAQAEEALAGAEVVEEERARALEAAQQESGHARSLLARADAAGQEAAAAVRDAERQLEARRSRHDVLRQEHGQVQERLLDTERGQEELAQAQTDAEQALEAARLRRQEAEGTLADADATRRSLDEQIEQVRDALAAARRQHDAAAAEAEVIASLLDSYEGFSEAVQTLLEEPAWAASPRTVADVLDSPPHLRLAIDAALGPFGDCLVVESEAEARAGIQRLAAAEAGRATFLVLERLPQRGPQVVSPTPPGAEPLSAALGGGNGMPARLTRALLSNYFLISDLEEAQRLVPSYPIARFVTPAGEWAGGGMLRAGSAERTASVERIGRRDQLQAAEALRAEAAIEVQQYEERLASLRGQYQALSIDALRAARDDAQRVFSDAARTADRTRARADSERLRQEELTARLTHLAEQLAVAVDTAHLEQAASHARSGVEKADAARHAAREAVEQAEGAARDAFEHHSEARLTAATARNQADSLRRELARARSAIAEIESRRASRAHEREQLVEAQAGAQQRHAEHAARAEHLSEALGELQEATRTAENSLLEGRAAVSDADTLLRDLRRLREEAREALGTAQLRQTETATRLEALEERIQSEYGLSVHDIEPPGDDFDAAGARAELPELRQQLRNLGAVNELALESYDEQKERLDFMLEQQSDLEQAEASLRDTIREINTTARERFEETFQAVREAFQDLFADLFGQNATADILLAGDDPLEDDIEIRARPKGKKPSAITQLSGGEKTLTAIALLFAIYLVKPSPFCILDEVDAPLDDANIERFMRLIRSFSESTQFILVTHNKLTMEAADRMYGVTMQEEGVSRLVGVRFSEVLPAAA